MKDSTKKWWGTFVTLVLVGVVAEIINHRLGGTGTLIMSFLRWVGRQISTTVMLPLWLLVLLILSGGGAVIAWLAIRASAVPTWRSYRKDRFFGVDWIWEYLGNAVYEPGLLPLCPRCAHQLREQMFPGYGATMNVGLQCEGCGFRTGDLEITSTDLERRVVQAIDRNVRTNAYPDAPPVKA